MNLFSFLIGFGLVYLGIAYICKPNQISKLNKWIREHIFTDRLILIHRRKVGVFLIFVGAVVIYFAVR